MLTCSCRNRLKHFSAGVAPDAYCAYRNLFPKKRHYVFVDDDKNTTKTMLQTGAQTSAHGMNKKNVKNELEYAALSILGKTRMIAINNPIKDMGLLNFIYSGGFRNLAAEHVLGACKELSENVSSLLGSALSRIKELK